MAIGIYIRPKGFREIMQKARLKYPHKFNCICSVCKARRGENKGWHHTEETKKKISKTEKGKYVSTKTRRKISKARKGKLLTAEHCRKMSVSQKIYYLSKKGKETKKRISEVTKEYWQNPEHREKRLKAIFKKWGRKPTKPEKELNKLLERLFPKEYKYVGNGYTFIAGKCPDFMNVNGQKKLIEYNSEFWHRYNRKRKGIPSEHQEDRIRKKHFARYGYKTCIVHERELFRKDKRLESKLIKFHGGKR